MPSLFATSWSTKGRTQLCSQSSHSGLADSELHRHRKVSCASSQAQRTSKKSARLLLQPLDLILLYVSSGIINAILSHKGFSFSKGYRIKHGNRWGKLPETSHKKDFVRATFNACNVTLEARSAGKRPLEGTVFPNIPFVVRLRRSRL